MQKRLLETITAREKWYCGQESKGEEERSGGKELLNHFWGYCYWENMSVTL